MDYRLYYSLMCTQASQITKHFHFTLYLWSHVIHQQFHNAPNSLDPAMCFCLPTTTLPSHCHCLPTLPQWCLGWSAPSILVPLQIFSHRVNYAPAPPLLYTTSVPHRPWDDKQTLPLTTQPYTTCPDVTGTRLLCSPPPCSMHTVSLSSSTPAFLLVLRHGFTVATAWNSRPQVSTLLAHLHRLSTLPGSLP